MQINFSTVPWAVSANIYEVNLRQYTPEGSFSAFESHLPRLNDMGVKILWFMPITPISLKGRQGSLGSYYACSDYINTNPEFGSLADFTRLVKTAHDLGMKVIIDWVANHTGHDHEWITTHPDFYRLDEDGNFTEAHGWIDVFDLNYDNLQLRETMIKAMSFWVKECDIDGFRCDMAHLVPLEFWKEARETITAIKPLFWLAETEEINYHPVFDASYTWKWMHESENFAKQKTDLPSLWEFLYREEHAFPGYALRAYFTSNHDENTWNGTEYEKYGPLAMLMAVFSCTWKGIPLIYSGQELPNMKRLKFFEKDTIEWKPELRLHEFYKKLLNLRSVNSALWAGPHGGVTSRIYTNSDRQVFAFRRYTEDDEVVVFLNFSERKLPVTWKNEHVAGCYTNLFSSDKVHLSVEEGIMLDVYGFWIGVRE